jgi:hypothetical protein
MSERYTTGTTVRVTAEFFDFGGQLIDPEAVTVRVYDARQKQIYEAVLDLVSARVSQGFYEHFYVVPPRYVANMDRYYVEFEGVIGGTPSVERAPLLARFSNEQRV